MAEEVERESLFTKELWQRVVAPEATPVEDKEAEDRGGRACGRAATRKRSIAAARGRHLSAGGDRLSHPAAHTRTPRLLRARSAAPSPTPAQLVRGAGGSALPEGPELGCPPPLRETKTGKTEREAESACPLGNSPLGPEG
jgi:hypothetical protein